MFSPIMRRSMLTMSTISSVQIEHHGFDHLPPAERQQLMRQRRRAAGRL